MLVVIKMRFYPREDLIDFPCSSLWAGHYADQGMTPGFPQEYYYKPPPGKQLEFPKPGWVKAQEGKIEQAQGLLRHLRGRLNEHLDKSAAKRQKRYEKYTDA